MTDYEMLKKAFSIMEDCFKDDVDKAGTPYIYHPMMVALQCSTTEEKVVGLLHDALEDHPEKVTIEMLRNEGFNDLIVEALQLCTHDKNVPYLDYVQRIKESKNPLAIAVKKADLTHNMDISRIQSPSENDYLRIEKKYKPALKIIEGRLTKKDGVGKIKNR